MKTRREFLIAGAGLCVLALPLSARAQQPNKVWRIGFFYNGSRESAMSTGRYPAFLDGMQRLGYVQGKHFVVVERWIANDQEMDRLPALAAEMAQSGVDIIVANGGYTVQSLKQATSSIPIVVTVTTDPVREGLVASLSHPGGNITGLGAFLDQVFPKHVEMLRLAVPKLSRVAALAHPRNPSHPDLLKAVEAAAHHYGIQVQRVDAATFKGIEQAIGTAGRQRAQALMVLGDTFFVQYFPQIAGFALRNRLPSIYSGREYPQAGGLMSYGPNFSENFRRAATYVDKILKGAKPGDLPIEQPTKFEFVVNRKTANALGITLSQELLFRTDEVIG